MAERMSEILSEGVCAFLKKRGFLGKKPPKKGPMKRILREMPEVARYSGEVDTSR